MQDQYKVESGLYYTKDHLWVKIDDGNAVVGISDYGQAQLGDVVFVELPEVGREIEAGEKVASVESIKAVVDVFSPLSGKITAVNEDLNEDPGLINTDPYGDGWIYELEVSDSTEIEDLMTSEDYEAYLEELLAEEEQ